MSVRFSAGIFCLSLSLALSPAIAGDNPRHRLAAFSADVTCPIGHPCMGGGIAPAKEILDPLFARGFILLGEGPPIVVVSVDWCEIRNDAYEAWRTAIAEAVNTTKERVLVSCIHQHDTPIADLEGQRILDTHKATGKICDLAFHAQVVQRVAKAAKDSIGQARAITHFGVGQARVDQLASNRRYLGVDGKPRFNRTSATRDAEIRAKPEGTIDPWLKTLSFWDGDQAVLALSCYATHPMSFYGRGGVTADFPGLARKRRQADDPKVFQIYASGCSGNVTAGKYNDGAVDNRPILADKIYVAMAEAWKNTQRHPIEKLTFRSTPLKLEPRQGGEFTLEALQARLADKRPFNQCLAALGLSWRKRVDAGAVIDVPAIDFGKAVVLLIPAESYVEFQLMAQKARPNDFVVVMGYGESAPGYIPIDQAFREGDGNLSDWCWVAPGSEERMRAAIKRVLKVESTGERRVVSPPCLVYAAPALHGGLTPRRSPGLPCSRFDDC